jgi:hypothetical protein
MAKLRLGVNQSRKTAKADIENLRKTLKANPHFSVTTKLRYRKAITQMRLVNKILSKLPCDPPDMSLPIPPPPPPSGRIARKSSRRKR